MEQQKSGFPLVGGDGEVLVPMVGAGHDAEVFASTPGVPVAQERADAEPVLRAACPGDRRRAGVN